VSQPSRSERIDLRWVAAATGVVIAMVAAAALLYLLLDILLLLFLGIVIAAALQPWHLRLGRWGVPRGLSVLLIYLLLGGALLVAAVVVGPSLVEGITHFVATLPDKYSSIRASSRNAPMPFRLLADQLPAFERLGPAFAKVAPQFYESALGLTTSVFALLTYLMTVLALAFYWTMEVPRFERLVVSLVPVGKRTRALAVWHQIEFKLGAYMRGQALAMFVIGAASGVGYAVVGLPHVLMLAMLAGLLEAVPVLGPVLAAVPAIFVAMTLGFHTVLLVVLLAVSLQVAENYFIMPRIMARTVGVSAMVSLVAVLAFGALYGLIGIFIAVPAAAVIQVVLESLVETAGLADTSSQEGPLWSGLRARVRALREEARSRLRGRDTRMGIDPGTTDHVVDAVDQQIEEAADRVETVLAAVNDKTTPLSAEDQGLLIELGAATEHIAELVDGNATLGSSGERASNATMPDEEALTNLSEATREMERAAERVETAVAERATSHESAEAFDEASASHPGDRSPSTPDRRHGR
jgi:predicted PurR-regulated permease PerM